MVTKWLLHLLGLILGSKKEEGGAKGKKSFSSRSFSSSFLSTLMTISKQASHSRKVPKEERIVDEGWDKLVSTTGMLQKTMMLWYR